jgi:hypothetical protein
MLTKDGGVICDAGTDRLVTYLCAEAAEDSL